MCGEVLIRNVFATARFHSRRQPCWGRQRSKRHRGTAQPAPRSRESVATEGRREEVNAATQCSRRAQRGSSRVQAEPWPPAWGRWTLRAALKSAIPMAVCCVKLYRHQLREGESRYNLKQSAQNRWDCILQVYKGVMKTFSCIFFTAPNCLGFALEIHVVMLHFLFFSERCNRKQENE